MAQLSLSRRAAAWLTKPATQRELEQRWNAILRNGSDAEFIRLLKELTDRVEGRPTEHVAIETVEAPDTVDGLKRLSPEQRRALLRQANQERAAS